MKHTAACHIKRHYITPLSETLAFQERLCTELDISNGGDPETEALLRDSAPVID